MRVVVFIVFCFGAISVYASPEGKKDEETHNVAVKMVKVGLIQMDVNTICRAAGYVTPADLEPFKSSGVISDSTKPTLKEVTEPITDKYDSPTSKNSSATEKYFSIDPRASKSGTAETVTEHTATSTDIETTTAGKDISIATIANISTSSDKEATPTKFLTYASEYNASIAAEEKGITKEITSTTEKEHTYTAIFDHTYIGTRKEDATSTTEVPRSTKTVEKLEHDSTSSGRTTRDTKEVTEKHTLTTVGAGLSETTEKLIGISTLSSDVNTSIATTRDERSPATDAHTGSTADFDDSSLTTTESEKSSVALSTIVTDEHTNTSVAKVKITLASPAAERTTAEPSSSSSATVTKDEHRTSPASRTPADGHDLSPVDVESTTVPNKSSTIESEKSSTTLKRGDKTAYDDKSMTEEPTYTTVAKEDTTSSVHKKTASEEIVTSEYNNYTTTTSGEKFIGSETLTTEAASGTPTTTERNNGSSTDKSSEHKKEASVETVTLDYHDHTTTSGEKLPKESSITEAVSGTSSTDKSTVHKKEASVETVTKEYHDHTTSGEKLPKASSTTVAVSGVPPTTTERNNGSSTDKIRSDRGKKVDYSVYGYLALSLLIAAIIIWISYLIYTRHQSNSYVLPATAAEATPLNHITTTT